jgi:hypothetical protein
MDSIAHATRVLQKVVKVSVNLFLAVKIAMHVVSMHLQHASYTMPLLAIILATSMKLMPAQQQHLLMLVTPLSLQNFLKTQLVAVILVVYAVATDMTLALVDLSNWTISILLWNAQNYNYVMALLIPLVLRV